jgi:Arc/MetJ-type ribon-helix-helix transcriptional regulator
MMIRLPSELASRVEAAVQRGQFASVDDAMAEAAGLLLRELERTRLPKPPAGQMDASAGSIGAMRDAADELDEIVSDAYKRRERPWRDLAIE